MATPPLPTLAAWRARRTAQQALAAWPGPHVWGHGSRVDLGVEAELALWDWLANPDLAIVEAALRRYLAVCPVHRLPTDIARALTERAWTTAAATPLWVTPLLDLVLASGAYHPDVDFRADVPPLAATPATAPDLHILRAGIRYRLALSDDVAALVQLLTARADVLACLAASHGRAWSDAAVATILRQPAARQRVLIERAVANPHVPRPLRHQLLEAATHHPALCVSHHPTTSVRFYFYRRAAKRAGGLGIAVRRVLRDLALPTADTRRPDDGPGNASQAIAALLLDPHTDRALLRQLAPRVGAWDDLAAHFCRHPNAPLRDIQHLLRTHPTGAAVVQHLTWGGCRRRDVVEWLVQEHLPTDAPHLRALLTRRPAGIRLWRWAAAQPLPGITLAALAGIPRARRDLVVRAHLARAARIHPEVALTLLPEAGGRSYAPLFRVAASAETTQRALVQVLATQPLPAASGLTPADLAPLLGARDPHTTRFALRLFAETDWDAMRAPPDSRDHPATDA